MVCHVAYNLPILLSFTAQGVFSLAEGTLLSFRRETECKCKIMANIKYVFLSPLLRSTEDGLNFWTLMKRSIQFSLVNIIFYYHSGICSIL